MSSIGTLMCSMVEGGFNQWQDGLNWNNRQDSVAGTWALGSTRANKCLPKLGMFCALVVVKTILVDCSASGGTIRRVSHGQARPLPALHGEALQLKRHRWSQV